MGITYAFLGELFTQPWLASIALYFSAKDFELGVREFCVKSIELFLDSLEFLVPVKTFLRDLFPFSLVVTRTSYLRQRLLEAL